MFCGKKVAFVATGGGSRAIAHIGVIKACQELGIKFDMLIGASAGAICITYYSQHQNLDMLIDNFRPPRKRKYDFRPFGWKRMFSFKNFLDKRIKNGIFSLDGAEEFFKNSFVTDDFDKLSIPTYISVTNLKENRGVIFGTGIRPKVPISKALAASCCLPILFRPVNIDGEYYADGDIKRIQSIQAAINFGADIIIVSDTYSPTRSIDYSTVGMVEIFSQITNMLFEDGSHRSIQICQSEHPDKDILLISPKITTMSAFNNSSYKRFISAGYRAAVKVLKKI